MLDWIAAHKQPAHQGTDTQRAGRPTYPRQLGKEGPVLFMEDVPIWG
jgi:hypothetical protein